MADMIARLKVDSSEYDSKIQRAAKGIQHLAEACHNAGAHLNVLEDENREYIQSLGNMATVATTARGKIAELTSAFIDIKSVYNSLSQEEKNGEFGKELNKQLDIMKGRIQEGKRELADINNEINGGGGLTGALDSLAGKFGMNIKQLAGWGTALAAAKGALDVAKDAFFANEQQLDEWGRTVQASESLYQGFLNAINNTDISGFLTRMDDIVSAARDAYNALDDLNTYSAFNQRNEMKERAGYTKALDEYKLNPTADNKKALADANKTVIDGLRETQQKAEEAYIKALKSIATDGLKDKNLQEDFVKIFSEGGRNALADAKIGYSQGKMFNAGAQYWYGDRVYDGRIQDRSTGKWRDMSQQEKQNFEFARAIAQVNDEQIRKVQALGQQTQAIADQIYQQDRAYNRMAGNNGKVTPGPGGGGGRATQKVEDIFPSGSLKDLQQQLQELKKVQDTVTDPTQWQAYQQAIDGVNEKINVLKGNLPKDSRAEFRFEAITDDVMAKLREVEDVHISTKPVTITADTSEAMDALKSVEGIHIDPKTLVITADNAEALEKAKAINGVTVDDKTLRIVADTSEAMQQVQQLTSSIENQEVVIRPTVAFAKELPSLPTLVPKIELPKMPDIKPLKMQIKAELDAQALKADEQTLKTILQDSIQNGINGMDFQFASLNDQIVKGINVPDEKWQAILEQYNKLREAIGETPIEIDFKTGNIAKNGKGGGNKSDVDSFKNFNDKFSQLNSGVGSIVSGIQQMGVEIPKELQSTLSVLQGISTIMTGVLAIMTIMNAKQTAQTAMSFIPFFAHGGLVHAATGYMVPGNDHADRTLIAASSGELILNRAQQGVIAGALEDGALRSIHVTGMLRGEDIVLVADRWGRRTGNGELAFFK